MKKLNFRLAVVLCAIAAVVALAAAACGKNPESDGKPAYSVTFVGGEGAEGTAPAMPDKREGEAFALPDNTFKRAGCAFAGWGYGDQTYNAGVSFTMPASAVVFTAEWTLSAADKVTPTIVAPPSASSFVYGGALSQSAFSGGAATVGGAEIAGTFRWINPAFKPAGVGTAQYDAEFVPNDTDAYNAAALKVSAAVLPLKITVNAPSGYAKVYDGTADFTAFAPGGLVGDDTVVLTARYDDAHAGTGKAIAFELSGADAGNYTVPDPVASGAITQRPLTAVWQSDALLRYSGEPQSVSAAVSGAVAGDEVSFTYEGASQTDNGKYTASIDGVTGADAEDYALSGDISDFEYVIADSITTEARFIGIGNAPDGYYVLDADLDFASETFNGLESFAGVFEGNGHKIANASLNGSAVFGDLTGGEVRNTLFVGIKVAGGEGAAVSLLNGTIANCFIDVEFLSGATGAGVMLRQADSMIRDCVVRIATPNNSSGTDLVTSVAKYVYGGEIHDTLILAGADSAEMWLGYGGYWGNGNAWVFLNGNNIGMVNQAQKNYQGQFTSAAALLAVLPDGGFKTAVEPLLPISIAWGNNGNATGGVPATDYYPAAAGFNTSLTLPANPFTPDGEYVFIGWSDGTGVYQPGVSYKLLRNAVFTAVFAEPIGLTYSDGGAGEVSETYLGGPYALKPASAFTKAGYTLLYWSDGAKEYAPGSAYAPTEDTVFTAVWYERVGDEDAFAALSGKTSGNYILAADLDFASKTFNGLESFAGVFEGDGHRIANVSLNGSAVFGDLTGGEVRNTLFVGIKVAEGEGAAVSLLNGTIANCFIDVEFLSGATGAGVMLVTASGMIRDCSIRIVTPNNSSAADEVTSVAKHVYGGEIHDTLILAGADSADMWLGYGGYWGNGNAWVFLSGNNIGMVNQVQKSYPGQFTSAAALLAALPDGARKTALGQIFTELGLS